MACQAGTLEKVNNVGLSFLAWPSCSSNMHNAGINEFELINNLLNTYDNTIDRERQPKFNQDGSETGEDVYMKENIESRMLEFLLTDEVLRKRLECLSLPFILHVGLQKFDIYKCQQPTKAKAHVARYKFIEYYSNSFNFEVSGTIIYHNL